MLAWHYTTGHKFQCITATGMLIPGGIGIDPPEKPILWFSRNQHWEQTAGRAWHEDGQPMRRLTMLETCAQSGGLVRYGCDPKRLYAGEALQRQARMTDEDWAALCVEGRRQKAYPAVWCGSVDSIPVDNLVVHLLSDSFKWEGIPACGR
jgi:hypothetical protein